MERVERGKSKVKRCGRLYHCLLSTFDFSLSTCYYRLFFLCVHAVNRKPNAAYEQIRNGHQINNPVVDRFFLFDVAFTFDRRTAHGALRIYRR